MLDWVEKNKKIILLMILFLLILMTAFYSFMIRPLVAEKRNHQQQLDEINADISAYKQGINKLKPERLSGEEQALLISSIPGKPNVEDIIKDLQKVASETGAVIENISSTINGNGTSNNGTPNANATQNKQANNGSAQQAGQGNWENIFPKEVLDKLKNKMADVNNLKVSYVEMTIKLNGTAANMNDFVKQIENLNRITHIQSYQYSINEAGDHRVEGTVTIRSYYTKNSLDH